MDIALITGLFVVLAAFAFVGLLYLTRGTPVERVRNLDGEGDPPAISDPGFCDTLEAHVNTVLVPGNRLVVLANGAVYPRLWEDLSCARDLITWHVFWFKPGRLADRLKEVLVERARAGVQVLFLYDYIGARGIAASYYDALRDAGVEVAAFRPLRWNTLHKLQQRSHIRAVVIDGRIGYTGGFSIEDHWLGDGRHRDQWRDTSARVEGPAARQLQSAFAADWAEATGQLLVGDRAFPEELATRSRGIGDGDGGTGGTSVAGLVYAAPSMGSTDAERFLALSIVGARRRLYVTNPYFIPDDDFRRLLVDAVERGVDVRVLTPGANSDRRSTWYAGRAHYEELLAGGVRIFEYRPTMVHAKTLVVDGIWSAVGTINFDNRSMALNDEVTLMTYGRDVAQQLEQSFLRDLELADELSLDAFRRRGLGGRLIERASLLVVRLL